MSVVKVFGPPGTGKTTLLVDKFVRLVHVTGGTDRVAAITYTRAAADELRIRIAAKLGLMGTPDTFRKALPYVGTVHSLAWHLIGKPALRDAGEKQLEAARPDGQDTVRAESAMARAIYALARNCMISNQVAYDQTAEYLTPGQAQDFPSFPRVQHLITEYALEKVERDMLDFEDVLVKAARSTTLPVRAILVDEAQDNSALMWQVVQDWAHRPGVALAIYAGDPWQAIYRHVGADPTLLLYITGRWKILRRSHRLGQPDALYAQALLLEGGWRGLDSPEMKLYDGEKLMLSWHGMGGRPVDGSVMHLARTNLLVREVEKDLRRDHVPYGSFDGHSAPLEQRAGAAARVLARLSEGVPQHAAVIARSVTAALARDWRHMETHLEPLLQDEHEVIGRDEFVRLTQTAPEQWLRGLVWGEYFSDLRQWLGWEALIAPPKTRVGTIHAAKGREADEVYLYESWGSLPSTALMQSAAGQRAEACVAYVGATRHRTALHLSLLDRGYGTSYPFPTLQSVLSGQVKGLE